MVYKWRHCQVPRVVEACVHACRRAAWQASLKEPHGDSTMSTWISVRRRSPIPR